MLQTFRELVRNPIGVIGLFVLLVYLVGTAILPLSSVDLSNDQKWVLIVFVVGFPVLILACFLFLVIRHHHKLYAPMDYRNEEHFLQTLPAEQQRRRLEAEIEGEARESLGRKEVAPKETEQKVADADTRVKHALAEDLALRQVEEEFGRPVKRHVSVRNRIDLAFDGAVSDDRFFYFVEVKYTEIPYLSRDTVKALIRRHRQVEELLGVDPLRDYSSRYRLLLVIVADMTEEQRFELENEVARATERVEHLVTRVYDLNVLREKFGA